MKCPSCAKVAPPRAAYCSACGTRLKAAAPRTGAKRKGAEPATRLERLAAKVLDGLAWGGVVVTVMLVFAPDLSRSRDPGPEMILTLALSLLLFLAAQAVLLTRRGQTVGKMLLAIRVVDAAGGGHGGFLQNVFLRSWVNALLCGIPLYKIVDVLFIFRADRRCLHDLLAGTAVVRARQ